jgi:TolA-binding protein
LIRTRYLLYGFLLTIIFAINSSNVFCQDNQLNNILKELESNDFIKRQSAQENLTAYLENIGDSERENVLGRLLVIINDNKESIPLKIEISFSIGQISNFFWKVENQKTAEDKLYELFRKTTDQTLKKNIDRALMKAEGLYWDAINDYNVGKLGKATVDNAENKFKRVYYNFPESEYAPRAHYYLAKYFTRIYLKRKDKDLSADINYYIANKSNSAYETYFKMVNEGKYNHKEEMNARYYYALNFVLLGKLDEAINQLEIIKNSKIKDKYKIYVYEFYYSDRQENILNRYFPSDDLATYTMKYLKDNPSFNDNYMKGFINYLNKYGTNG